MTEQDALMVLNAVLALGNARLRRLLQFYGSARRVLEQNEKELCAATGMLPEIAAKIYGFERAKFLEKEHELLTRHGVAVVAITDAHYPASLKAIPDAPVLLYIKGEILPSDECGLAIVGSRKASVYGISVAERFATRFAEMGITVVSGLARGIDAAAHRGSLTARGRTLAVLGSGLAEIYPPEHEELYAKIAASGAVISEFPMTTPPYAFNFPRRNRIVSGLSLGVLVVEASQRSGALITSEFALEQGREVFAVPGRVDTHHALGTHQLIKSGAKLVSSVDDVLEELAPRLRAFAPQPVPPVVPQPETNDTTPANKPQATPVVEVSQTEHDILAQLSRKPLSLEEIAATCQMAIEALLPLLLKLELRRKIRQLPGKYFVRS